MQFARLNFYVFFYTVDVLLMLFDVLTLEEPAKTMLTLFFARYEIPIVFFEESFLKSDD